jgi:hypothetical protein
LSREVNTFGIFIAVLAALFVLMGSWHEVRRESGSGTEISPDVNEGLQAQAFQEERLWLPIAGGSITE